jgi:non-ribosomal peptide synthetase component F
VVGADSANHRPETEPLIGFFINLLALRTDLGGDPDFVEVLRRVRVATLGAYAHRELPFDRVVAAVGARRAPVPLAPLELPGLTIEPLALERRLTDLDLTLHIYEVPGGLRAVFEYRTAVLDATTIARLAGHYRAVLEQALAAPETRVSGFARLLTARDRAARLAG